MLRRGSLTAAVVAVIGFGGAAATMAAAGDPPSGSGMATSASATATPTEVTTSTPSGIPPGPPRGGPNQQTLATVTPHHGASSTQFVLSLTVRETLGVQGVTSTDYAVQIDPPVGSAPACAPLALAPLQQGAPGQLLGVALVPGAGGAWCDGEYTVTVFLERGPYCRQDQPPCPEFASQRLDVGDTGFGVGLSATQPPHRAHRHHRHRHHHHRHHPPRRG